MNSITPLNPVILPSICILIILAIEIGIHIANQSQVITATRKDRSSLRTLWAVVVISIIVAVPFGHYHIPSSLFVQLNDVGIVVVLLVLATGVFIRFWAIQTLGKYFTVNVAIHYQHELINKGPYSLIRHPSYTGLLLELLALAISYQHISSICIIMVSSIAAFLIRIHIEEKLLIEYMGEKYKEYRCHTYALVPYLF